MSAPLQAAFKAVDPIVFGINWFRPLGAPAAIAAKRWAAGMAMPYRWVSVASHPRVGYLSFPTIRVHTLAATYTEAAREAARTDERAQVLVDHPGWGTTMPDGAIVSPIFAEIIESAHEEPYAAETVATRLVSEYRFGFKLVAA
jgi:hypothetical protein